MTDADLAAALADQAGRLLLDLRRDGRLTGDALGNEADAQANALLMSALAAARPGDGILSEETECDGARLAKRRVWIIDPLDGTREYREGRDDWAVHVALAIDGAATVGAVALPALGELLRSDRPAPLGTPVQPPRLLVSRTRPPPEAVTVARNLGATLVPMGSAGAKAMAVIRGEAEVYLHAGGQHEWDNCAPVAVARAHGLHCSRLDGAPLTYNHRDSYVPDLLICRTELAGAILALLTRSEAE